jgi:pimeloyl-ACP methyl ester carboxylesterase
MQKRKCVVILFLVAGFARSANAAQNAGWRDPSPHTVSFVSVAEGVDLEVLDWGGRGHDLVLLAGSGASAHVFDELAPKLTDCCHVRAITRRGHGRSSHPASGYDDQQLANDLFQAISRLRLDRPILIGHSAAGGEMTTLTRQHPDLPAGLVYLDAIGDLEDDPPADAEWLALQQRLPPGVKPSPSCDPLDRSSFEAFRTTWAAESDLRSHCRNCTTSSTTSTAGSARHACLTRRSAPWGRGKRSERTTPTSACLYWRSSSTRRQRKSSWPPRGITPRLMPNARLSIGSSSAVMLCSVDGSPNLRDRSLVLGSSISDRSVISCFSRVKMRCFKKFAHSWRACRTVEGGAQLTRHAGDSGCCQRRVGRCG